nr:hypothetical protein [Tanacetum cinerariifolium]
TDEPNLSATTTIVEVSNELPKVSMVNSCLKKLKYHLASFDMVVKERTTATAITGACFRDDIIPFVKALKELFTSFDQYLIDDVTEVQHVFKQMELAVEQHRKEKHKFQNKMEHVLQENDRLLTQALSVEIVNVVVHDNVMSDCLNVDVCAHCKNTLFSSESALTFAEFFEINELKAQAQAKDTVILQLKEKLCSLKGDVTERNVKQEVEEIETLNIELDHKLNKLKGKAVLTEAVSLNPIGPELLKVDVAPLVPKLRKNRTAHTDYIRHTQDEAATLREIVESERLLSPLNTYLDYACKYTRRIQELLMILQQTCLSLTELGSKLVVVTPKNKTKQIRPTEQLTKTVKSRLNKKSVVDSKATSSVINSMSNVISNLKCASCNGCLFSDNHDACVVDYIKSVNASRKSKSIKTPVKRKVWKPTGNVFKTVGHIWKPTGQTFKLVGNVCPLTRIATPTIVPPREPILIVNSMDKPVVTLVYTRKPKAANKKVPNKLEPNNSWGSSSSNVPSSLLTYRLSKSSSGTWTPVAQSI